MDSNDSVGEGDVLEVTVDVENTGDDGDTQEVNLSISDDVGEVDSDSITLDAEESETVTLEWETDDGDAGSTTQ